LQRPDKRERRLGSPTAASTCCMWHARYLAGARQYCDVLVVAINSDRSVQQLKGAHRPLVPAEERAELISHLEAVDYVVIFDGRDVRELLTILRSSHIKGPITRSTPSRTRRGMASRRSCYRWDAKSHSSTDLLRTILESAAERMRTPRLEPAKAGSRASGGTAN